ncbi:hypothetical protein ACHAXS_013979 [Conticribra weissflogii]
MNLSNYTQMVMISLMKLTGDIHITIHRMKTFDKSFRHAGPIFFYIVSGVCVAKREVMNNVR